MEEGVEKEAEAVGPSEAYYEALRDATIHHATNKTFSGKFLLKHYDRVKDLIAKYGVTSILDYGCGKCVQYGQRLKGPNKIHDGPTLEEYWGIEVFKYDPATSDRTVPPPEGQKYDMVICSHVLGCVPLHDLKSWFVDHLFSYANKVVYIVERVSHEEKQNKKDWTSVDGCRPGWNAMKWIDILQPAAMKAGVACVLCTVYPSEFGLVYGMWEF